jgi:hypothetical protein
LIAVKLTSGALQGADRRCTAVAMKKSRDERVGSAEAMAHPGAFTCADPPSDRALRAPHDLCTGKRPPRQNKLRAYEVS